MVILKCKMCGGDLNIAEGASTAECEYCGSIQTVPKVDDEKKLTLFSRANRLRAACDFDKAAGIYESIVADFPDEAEAYWGLVLCKYGIEYVDDPATGNKIPTCHRSSFDSVMEDENLEQALENADVLAQKVYRDEAKTFERIRKGILEVSAKEEPYDIFICYKETDGNGDRTVDSVLAQDLYTALTDKGYRVFFSRITLRGKLGEAYEPYIFAALNSAKVMLAVGTTYEYYNAVWVKNEWSRYLKICAADKSKHLIPCYKNLDPEDMPREFNHLQGADLGKMGAVQDILFNMEKYIPLKRPETAMQQTVEATNNPTTDSYLKRAFLFLEDGDFESANAYCEKVLDIDPENARAYLGKLMAQLRVKKQENLANAPDSFEHNGNYQKAVRFADEALRKTLEGYNRAVAARLGAAYLAQKQKQEQERKAKEKEFETRDAHVVYLEEIRKKWLSAQNLLAAASGHIAGVQTDGVVAIIGEDRFGEGFCNVGDWRNIVSVGANSNCTVGLQADGRVVATELTSQYAKYNLKEVRAWRDVVAVSVSSTHVLGMKKDGTVVAAGMTGNRQCDVGAWRKVVSVSAGLNTSFGVQEDGKVVCTGSNAEGQCTVRDWKEIVAVAAGAFHTVGLKADGTVLAVGQNKYGQCEVEDWQNIVAVAADITYTIGLQADGTVAIAGVLEEDRKRQLSAWKDVIAISCGAEILGLCADGTVKTTKAKNSGPAFPEAIRWKLFNNIENLTQERETARAQRAEYDRRMAEQTRVMAERRAAGVCQYCGGGFKGMFTKKCSKCGKPKDY